MTHDFSRDYWEAHWHRADADGHESGDLRPNPYVVSETADLAAATALDAGCGTGAEAVWLAERGWQVTAVDISETALAKAADRAAEAGASDRVALVGADLTSWKPDRRFDLVVTSYAHPVMPQLAFYRRISDWVADAGTVLIVGHLQDPVAAGSGSPGRHEHPPTEAAVTLADVLACFEPAEWRVERAEEHTRTVGASIGPVRTLRDVVVRAKRL
jgi:SAM-dependent methyltransferase